MAKKKRLCPHVMLRIKDNLLEFTGPAHPFFGWDVKLKADVPMLKCVACDKTVRRIFGKAIRKVKTI